MTKKSNEIAGKVVSFLRKEGGKAIISQRKDAGPVFNCAQTTLHRSLHELIDAGIISANGLLGRGHRQPVEFVLSENFNEDNSWREALGKRAGSVSKTSGPREKKFVPNPNRSLPTIRALLEENRNLYNQLIPLQEQIIQLQEEVQRLRKEVETLEADNNELRSDCRGMTDEIAGLDLKNRELASQVAANQRRIRDIASS